jgi:F0F1-type ATP synthase assembly protein I
MVHDPDPADAGLRGRDLIGLGGFLVGAIVVGTLLGLLLDHAAGSSPAFTLAGVFLGMVAGAVGFWLRVRAAMPPSSHG